MKKRVFALFTAMFLLCGMLAGCGPTGSSSTTTDGSDDGAKDTLIVAIPESPTYMDPMVQASIGTYRVTTQMFDRLVMMDNDMNLVPGLAESWEVIDDTTYRVPSAPGRQRVHNGEEMTLRGWTSTAGGAAANRQTPSGTPVVPAVKITYWTSSSESITL